MSHELVKILVRESGEAVLPEDQVWCLSWSLAGAAATFCTGEVFGEGEGHAQYETKTVKRGGITCPVCLQTIKEIKSIKL